MNQILFTSQNLILSKNFLNCIFILTKINSYETNLINFYLQCYLRTRFW